MQRDEQHRIQLIINGQVQGVGFRPFIYRLALEKELTGSVLNSPEGVSLEIQGLKSQIDLFEQDLCQKLPPLAQITSLERRELAVQPKEDTFKILPSKSGQGHQVLISPDTATCEDCLTEISDPQNRRFQYPFTNCTNCGPRYTITQSIPYDRDKTSMACFPLCPQCAQEYNNPLDRRFHAQPNACPVCGPEIWLSSPQGEKSDTGTAALISTVKALLAGKVVAIKGLGGFHLACEASNESAVHRLRSRKNRWGKPLALMVPDLNSARKLAMVSDQEEKWLEGNKRPILLLSKKESSLPANLAPDTNTLGLMLPYTPLHYLLLRHLQDLISREMTPALVMTSGNMSSEPIALGNREALNRLADIADLFLLHNRDILIRCDDSVLRINPETKKTLHYRRARGFTPSPIALGQEGPQVLGLGAENKSTICLTKRDQAFISQHIGDLYNPETLDYYRQSIIHLQGILQCQPQALVCDLHPDYLSTAYAREQDKLPVFSLQHHYAHIHAVLAENRYRGPALGLALDGTGLGTDGTLWGGELLYVHNMQIRHRRLGQFRPILLPGGEIAINEPWRTAQSYLYALNIFEPGKRKWPWLEDYASASTFLPQMMAKKINTPQTSSCGRLFDALSALLGLCLKIEYEGQAAIRLEKIQDLTENSAYACPVYKQDGKWFLDNLYLFYEAWEEWKQGIAADKISRRFHLGLARGLADWAHKAAQETGIDNIALSGGVLQNLTLGTELSRALKSYGLTPLEHTQVPPNDACISLGQAAYGQLILSSSNHCSLQTDNQ
jgi:hydrogenase maturation protein HypF